MNDQKAKSQSRTHCIISNQLAPFLRAARTVVTGNGLYRSAGGASL
ncbi:hypothetical protein [Bradyrhizobium sp. S3.9.1]